MSAHVSPDCDGSLGSRRKHLIQVPPLRRSCRRSRPRPDDPRGRRQPLHYQPGCVPHSTHRSAMIIDFSSAGPFSTAELCEVVLKIAPETPNVPKPEAGSVAFWKDHKNVVRSDGSKAERELGIKYKTVEETATDSTPLIVYRSGWVPLLTPCPPSRLASVQQPQGQELVTAGSKIVKRGRMHDPPSELHRQWKAARGAGNERLRHPSTSGWRLLLSPTFAVGDVKTTTIALGFSIR